MSRNQIIILINLFALFFVIQIELEAIPLFPLWFDWINFEGLNRAILRISYGIIVSSIFYLLVVSISENKKRRANRHAIQARLNSIYIKTLVGTLYMSKKSSSVEEKSSLRLLEEGLTLKYSFQDKTKIWHPITMQNVDEIQYYANEARHIKKSVDEIFAIPNTNTQPDELIKALVHLRDGLLYKIAIDKSNQVLVLYSNLDDSINEYIKNHKIISKYCDQSNIRLEEE